MSGSHAVVDKVMMPCQKILPQFCDQILIFACILSQFCDQISVFACISLSRRQTACSAYTGQGKHLNSRHTTESHAKYPKLCHLSSYLRTRGSFIDCTTGSGRYYRKVRFFALSIRESAVILSSATMGRLGPISGHKNCNGRIHFDMTSLPCPRLQD